MISTLLPLDDPIHSENASPDYPKTPNLDEFHILSTPFLLPLNLIFRRIRPSSTSEGDGSAKSREGRRREDRQGLVE
jgi:hypothetical protein